MIELFFNRLLELFIFLCWEKLLIYCLNCKSEVFIDKIEVLIFYFTTFICHRCWCDFNTPVLFSIGKWLQSDSPLMQPIQVPIKYTTDRNCAILCTSRLYKDIIVSFLLFSTSSPILYQFLCVTFAKNLYKCRIPLIALQCECR